MKDETLQIPFYQRVLGEAWESLPEPLQAMHRCVDCIEATGMATVERGNGLLSRLVAALIGFPEAGSNVSLKIRLESRNGGEIWRRTFVGQSFESRQTEGRAQGFLYESFGVMKAGIALIVEGQRLNYIVRTWSLFGIPMPSRLAPTGRTFEYVEDGRFCFHVEIASPFTGLIVRYRGWLVPLSVNR